MRSSPRSSRANRPERRSRPTIWWARASAAACSESGRGASPATTRCRARRSRPGSSSPNIAVCSPRRETTVPAALHWSSRPDRYAEGSTPSPGSRPAATPIRSPDQARGARLRGSPPTFPLHVFLEDLREPSRARSRALGVRQHEVDLGERVASVLERQHLQLAGRNLLADLLLRVPGEAEAHARGLERRRHVADRPALLGLEKAAALVSLDARVAHDQVAVLAKVLEREPTAEPEQGMIRMSGRHEEIG